MRCCSASRRPGSLVYARTEAHRNRVRSALRAAGIEESRADFVGHQPLADYLATYRSIDVALDPHPYGGGTTTCDALWMGVPVVSLAGHTAVSRAGSTLLGNVGLEHLVAHSKEQYVELAAGLIRDADRAGRVAAPASRARRVLSGHGCEAVRRRTRGRVQGRLACLVRALALNVTSGGSAKAPRCARGRFTAAR